MTLLMEIQQSFNKKTYLVNILTKFQTLFEESLSKDKFDKNNPIDEKQNESLDEIKRLLLTRN